MSSPEPTIDCLMSPTVGEIADALSQAQAEFPPLPRSKTVQVRSDKGSYKFSYAPLDEILTAVRPTLAKHGLALTQTFRGPVVRTILLHTSGEWIASDLPLPTMPAAPQQLGSLITYVRRYAVVSILGVAAEDDDDGNAAQGNQATAVARPAEDNGLASEAQVKKIRAMIHKLAGADVIDAGAFATGLAADYGVAKAEELTRAEASDVIDLLTAKEKAAA